MPIGSLVSSTQQTSTSTSTEYQLRLGRQRQVWFIPLADERGLCRCAGVQVQVKLWDPLRTRVIPERLRGAFTTRRYTNSRLPLPLQVLCINYWHSYIAVAQSKSCGNFHI